MDKILIVEDNKDLNLLLVKMLKESGYMTVSAYDGLEAVKVFTENDFSLVLLDIMLPYKSGDLVLSEIRKLSNVPVIIISAKDMTGTKIDLLRLGADDYVTKPFDLGEIEARIEASLRRANAGEGRNKQFTYDSITLNPECKSVHVNGVRLELTGKEYSILEMFMKYPQKIFSKGNIYESVWGDEYLGDDSTVKSHISRLRTKLNVASGEEYFDTVWGMGYRLKK